MVQNIIIGVIGLVVIVWGSVFLIGIFFGVISYVLKLIFYSSIIITIRFITFILRKIFSLFKNIYRKICNIILDKIYPDKGAYLINFGKQDQKGTTRIKYVSIR